MIRKALVVAALMCCGFTALLAQGPFDNILSPARLPMLRESRLRQICRHGLLCDRQGRLRVPPAQVILHKCSVWGR